MIRLDGLNSTIAPRNFVNLNALSNVGSANGKECSAIFASKYRGRYICKARRNLHIASSLQWLSEYVAERVILARHHFDQAILLRPLPQDSGAKASSQSLPSPRRGMGEPTERRLPTTPQGWPRPADRSKTSGWPQGRPSGPVEVGGRLPPRPLAACCGARCSQEGRPPT